jgi:hypothetical protein
VAFWQIPRKNFAASSLNNYCPIKFQLQHVDDLSAIDAE